jgi:uncharacterized circularly permuted ATP-grasp superfamily protein
MEHSIIPNGRRIKMTLTIRDLEWQQIKDGIDYMEKSLEKYMNEMDVYYDVAFVKDGIVFDFIFQHDDLESINVYKMEDEIA